MGKDTVLMVGGSGTIGAPVTMLLAAHREELGIRVAFSKQRPDPSHVPDVQALRSGGALFCVPARTLDSFLGAGYEVDCAEEDMIHSAAVVCDCTNARDGNMPRYRELFVSRNVRRAIANGGASKVRSSDEWLFVRGVNDGAFADSREVGVASCNEHAISAILDSLWPFGIDRADVTLARRGQDIDKADGHVAAPSVGLHDDPVFGTKHGRHVAKVFEPLGRELAGTLKTSAFMVSTPIFHTITVTLRTVARASRDGVLRAFAAHRLIAFTQKAQANRIFAHARTALFAGRVLAQVVIYEPSVQVLADGTIVFHAFTPQDGNVAISNVAAVVQALHPDSYDTLLRPIEDARVPREV